MENTELQARVSDLEKALSELTLLIFALLAANPTFLDSLNQVPD